MADTPNPNWRPPLSGNDHRTDEAIRIAFDNLFYLRDRITQVASTIPAPAPTIAQIQSELQVGGGYSLNLTGLLGTPSSSTSFTQGLYSIRPSVTVADNNKLFYATDQSALYAVIAGVWTWVAGLMFGTITPDTRPTLLSSDLGFTFLATDTVQLYIWKGAAWVIPKITETQLTLADNTTDDVTTAKHGFVPKSTNDVTKYLQDGNPPNWVEPDHTQISNIGTNSHAQIDSHIGSKVQHGYLGTVTNAGLGPGTMAADTYLQYTDSTNHKVYWVWCDGINRIGSGFNYLTGLFVSTIWAGLS